MGLLILCTQKTSLLFLKIQITIEKILWSILNSQNFFDPNRYSFFEYPECIVQVPFSRKTIGPGYYVRFSVSEITKKGAPRLGAPVVVVFQQNLQRLHFNFTVSRALGTKKGVYKVQGSRNFFEEICLLGTLLVFRMYKVQRLKIGCALKRPL